MNLGVNLVSRGSSAAEREEVDNGRRGKGYNFGAVPPGDRRDADPTYSSQSADHGAAVLEGDAARTQAEVTRVYAIVDNRQAYRATVVLPFGPCGDPWLMTDSSRSSRSLTKTCAAG